MRSGSESRNSGRSSTSRGANPEDDIVCVDDEDEIEVVNDPGPDTDTSRERCNRNVYNQNMLRFVKPDPFQVGDKVYGLERGLKDAWREAIIEGIENHFGKKVIRLKFVPGERITHRRKCVEERVVNCRHIAFFDPPDYQIPVGCRVIARTLDKTITGNFFFAGVVAEPPKTLNKNRYLIFFDDGLAAYCTPKNVRLTFSNTPTSKLWSDVHPDNQKFIRQYVNAYPQNSLANLRMSAITTVEWNGYWWSARVKELDCSLARLEIISNRLIVDVWKGSSRLLSIYKENGTSPLVRLADTNEESDEEIKAFLPIYTNEEYEGKIKKLEIPWVFKRKPVEYKTHDCNRKCWGDYKGIKSDLQKLSPLVEPYYYGWDRKIDPDDPRRQIYYQTPCGLKLYTIENVQEFVTKLECPLGIDSFCFDFAVQCLDTFEIAKPAYHRIYDISYGMERVPISKVNAVDDEVPEDLDYTNERVCGKGVLLNTDPEFLVCCDCVDDCTDKIKCACVRLTFENEPEFFADPKNFTKGYNHRRLRDKYELGIYECNQKCKCRSTCVNRVVQHGLKWNLQVFKTSSKGYAIRTMQDIPEGSFICVYTGELFNTQQANEMGAEFGDEYLANIDFIEYAEKHKEGYEEFAIEPEEPKAKQKPVRKNDRAKTWKKRKRAVSSESEGETEEDNVPCSKTRQLFGPHEDTDIYTIDARSLGNIGRYLNHSCEPNVFAQDVFLDTHDIRFPWVGFFASRYLKSGTELTWDYNYEVGMAKGRTVYCNCGALSCRKRLL